MKAVLVDLDKLQSGDELPDEALLARLCGYEKLNKLDGTILLDNFTYRKFKDKYVSVFCIDHYKDAKSTREKLSQLRLACNSDPERLNIGGKAKFVVAKYKFWKEKFNFRSEYRPEGTSDYLDHGGLFYPSNDINFIETKALEIVKFINANYNEFVIPVSDLD